MVVIDLYFLCHKGGICSLYPQIKKKKLKSFVVMCYDIISALRTGAVLSRDAMWHVAILLSSISFFSLKARF